MNAGALQGRLKTRHLGRTLETHESLPSTNAAARHAARDGAPHGAVFIAAEQTAGRGRFSRAWASPRGGLWMSLLLRPGPDPAMAQFIPMAAALALRACLRESCVSARLAWPNDLMARGRKLAGLLAESVIRGAELEYVILGMGINVNNSADSLPEELRGAAISCMDLAGAPIELEALASDLLNAFEPLCDEIARCRGGRIFEEWKTALELIGKRVSVRSGNAFYEGVVLDIAEGGALVLRLDNNETAAVPMDRGSLHTDKYSKEL